MLGDVLHDRLMPLGSAMIPSVLRIFNPMYECGKSKRFILACVLLPIVGLSNILDSKGREDISGSSPVKRTHGAGVAATLVGS